MEEYIKEMRKYIENVWNDLPNEGGDWEQSVECLEFKIFELDPFVPTLNDESDYDLAYDIARYIISKEYS